MGRCGCESATGSGRSMLDLIAEYEGKKLAYAFGARLRPEETASWPPPMIFMPDMRAGQSTIDEVYPRDDLIAFVDAAGGSVFFSEQHSAAVERRLVLDKSNGRWLVSLDGKVRLCTPRPITELAANHIIKLGDKGILKDWECTVFDPPGGQCVNIVSIKTNKVVYSVKMPAISIAPCRPSPDETCEHGFQDLDIEVFKLPNCKGPSVKKTVTWATCEL